MISESAWRRCEGSLVLLNGCLILCVSWSALVRQQTLDVPSGYMCHDADPPILSAPPLLQKSPSFHLLLPDRLHSPFKSIFSSTMNRPGLHTPEPSPPQSLWYRPLLQHHIALHSFINFDFTQARGHNSFQCLRVTYDNSPLK